VIFIDVRSRLTPYNRELLKRFRSNALPRLFFVLLLVSLGAGCGDNVVEYEMHSAAIEQFTVNAEKLVKRDDANSPLAMSVLSSNQIGAPAGVQIWKPETTLKSAGINNGDIIALVDGQVPSREYGHAFAAGQKPFGSATEQYVHFVSGLLALRNNHDSILLSIHPQYRTKAERKEHGGLHTKEANLIRIVFR